MLMFMGRVSIAFSTIIIIVRPLSLHLRPRLIGTRPACSFQTNGDNCQSSIFSIEGKKTSNINVYNLNTVGAISMIDLDGVSVATYSDNVDVFPDNIAVFRLE